MRMLTILLSLLVGAIGCAMLQEAPVVEISASRLSCEKNPSMVDGNLATVSNFEASGAIRKGFERGGISHRQYQREVVGSLKTETLIKLDTPTYIDYIEVWPASKIPNLILDTTAEEKSPKWGLSFQSVADKRGEDIEGTQPVRFRVQRKVLYLQVTAYALQDSRNAAVYDEDSIAEMAATLEKRGTHPKQIERLQKQWRKQGREGVIKIPLKGAAIREIKFYGR